MSDLKKHAEELVRLCANEAQHILVEFQLPIVQESFTLNDFIRQEKIRQKSSRTHQHKHTIHAMQSIKNLRARNIINTPRIKHK